MFFWRKKSEITRCKRNTQDLSDNLYLMLCCAAHSPLDPRFPGHIHALCVQHPLSAESSCAVFCHHAVNSPHRGDLTPRPVPHLEHRDGFHCEEFSWRQQVKQHKVHRGLCRGAVVPAIRWLRSTLVLLRPLLGHGRGFTGIAVAVIYSKVREAS